MASIPGDGKQSQPIPRRAVATTTPPPSTYVSAELSLFSCHLFVAIKPSHRISPLAVVYLEVFLTTLLHGIILLANLSIWILNLALCTMFKSLSSHWSKSRDRRERLQPPGPKSRPSIPLPTDHPPSPVVRTTIAPWKGSSPPKSKTTNTPVLPDFDFRTPPTSPTTALGNDGQHDTESEDGGVPIPKGNDEEMDPHYDYKYSPSKLAPIKRMPTTPRRPGGSGIPISRTYTQGLSDQLSRSPEKSREKEDSKMLPPNLMSIKYRNEREPPPTQRRETTVRMVRTPLEPEIMEEDEEVVGKMSPLKVDKTRRVEGPWKTPDLRQLAGRSPSKRYPSKTSTKASSEKRQISGNSEKSMKSDVNKPLPPRKISQSISLMDFQKVMKGDGFAAETTPSKPTSAIPRRTSSRPLESAGARPTIRKPSIGFRKASSSSSQPPPTTRRPTPKSPYTNIKLPEYKPPSTNGSTSRHTHIKIQTPINHRKPSESRIPLSPRPLTKSKSSGGFFGFFGGRSPSTEKPNLSRSFSYNNFASPETGAAGSDEDVATERPGRWESLEEAMESKLVNPGLDVQMDEERASLLRSLVSIPLCLMMRLELTVNSIVHLPILTITTAAATLLSVMRYSTTSPRRKKTNGWKSCGTCSPRRLSSRLAGITLTVSASSRRG